MSNFFMYSILCSHSIFTHITVYLCNLFLSLWAYTYLYTFIFTSSYLNTYVPKPTFASQTPIHMHIKTFHFYYTFAYSPQLFFTFNHSSSTHSPMDTKSHLFPSILQPFGPLPKKNLTHPSSNFSSQTHHSSIHLNLKELIFHLQP